MQHSKRSKICCRSASKIWNLIKILHPRTAEQQTDSDTDEDRNTYRNRVAEILMAIA